MCAQDETAPATECDGVVILKESCSPCLNAKICLARSSKRGGRGLFAKQRIAKGEVVWRQDDASSSKAYAIDYVMALPEEAKKAFLHFAYCTWPRGRRWECWMHGSVAFFLFP